MYISFWEWVFGGAKSTVPCIFEEGIGYLVFWFALAGLPAACLLPGAVRCGAARCRQLGGFLVYTYLGIIL